MQEYFYKDASILINKEQLQQLAIQEKFNLALQKAGNYSQLAKHLNIRRQYMSQIACRRRPFPDVRISLLDKFLMRKNRITKIMHSHVKIKKCILKQKTFKINGEKRVKNIFFVATADEIKNFTVKKKVELALKKANWDYQVAIILFIAPAFMSRIKRGVSTCPLDRIPLLDAFLMLSRDKFEKKYGAYKG